MHLPLLLSLLLPLISAQTPPPADDWATAHMLSEHHISNFDPQSFFTLHDYDADSRWEASEIRRTYGLADGSTDGLGGPGATPGTSEQKKTEVVDRVLALFDDDKNGDISMHEWMSGTSKGNRLPDFGLGPGHHGDDEYEYEIHHFEKFHDGNTKEEDLIHPEDILHFKKHDDLEDEALAQEQQDRLRIVEKNIPSRFRKPGY